MTPAKLLLLSALAIAACVGQRPVSLKVNKKCVEEYKAGGENVASRFTDEQIAWFCQTGKFWKAGANVRKDISQDQQMTTGQLDFLNRLRACKGIKCLQKGGLKNVYRPRPPKPPPDVAADFPSSADYLQSVYDKIEAFDVESVSMEDHLADMRVHIIFDGLLYDAEHPLCDERITLAELCPQAVEPEHFNKIIALAPSDEPTQRQLALVDICTVMDDELDLYGLDFKTFEACKSSRILAENRRTAALACAQMSSALDGPSAFPEFAERVAWLRSDASKQIMMDSLQEKYEELDRHCAYLADSVREGDLGSMDDWLKDRRVRRQKRQGERVPDIQLLTNGLFYRPVERKEYRAMSAFDRVRFHAALNQLKYEQIDGISKYDLLVLYHTPSESPGAYWGPAFLPHHREWLKAVEIGLRLIDPAVAVPFWDSSLDEPLPQPKESILWSEEFMGNGDQLVTTGDFQNWPATSELPFLPGTMSLYRDVGASPYGGLYRSGDVDYTLAAAGYDQLTACVDPTFELTQGLVHMFVGGYMADIATSPNDPVFILHHSYVDYLWEKFRMQRQSRDERELQYPTDDTSCTEHHYATAQMKPFPITNIDGLSNIYTDEMYRFEMTHMGAERDCDFCNYDYMFCHPELNRCVSKIRPGGDCTGYSDNEALAVDACYKSICSGDTNKCEPTETEDGDRGDKVTRPARTTTEATVSSTEEEEVVVTDEPPVDDTTTTEEPPVDDTTTSEQPVDDTTTTTEEPVDEVSTTTEKAVPVKVTTPIDEEPVVDTTTMPPVVMDTTTTTEEPVDVDTTTSTMLETTTTLAEIVDTTTTTEQPVGPETSTGEPTGDTGLPTPSPPDDFDTVWFAFSIVSGASIPADPADYVPVAQAVTITATGLNVPQRYLHETHGVHMATAGVDLQRPLYPYGAYVQVMDPEKVRYFNTVEFKLEARTADGTACAMHCYLRLKGEYGACPDRLRLSPATFYSAPIPYSADLDEALEKAWEEDGGDKKNDYVVFACPERLA